MVVAAVQANVLWLLNLLDGCVRVLIGVAKAVEVTPDKLARRYPEVPSAPGSGMPLRLMQMHGQTSPLTSMLNARFQAPMPGLSHPSGMNISA
jgi:hypothetical protein